MTENPNRGIPFGERIKHTERVVDALIDAPHVADQKTVNHGRGVLEELKEKAEKDLGLNRRSLEIARETFAAQLPPDKVDEDPVIKLIDQQLEFSSQQVALAKEGDVTVEKLVAIQRFSPEAREKLQKRGYVIYALQGESSKTLGEMGYTLFSEKWYTDNHLEERVSRSTEVAVNPENLFLPVKNCVTLEQDEKIVNKFSKKLGKQIPGVQAIIGESADYVELAFRSLAETGERLFGEKYEYKYTRTKTRTKTPNPGSEVAYVGQTSSMLFVGTWGVFNRFNGLGVAPLVVPVSNDIVKVRKTWVPR